MKNGNKVELTEDADTGADEDVAATSAPESDSLYKADAEGFFSMMRKMLLLRLKM